ncbi:MAG: DUF4089 domain-containing protein [Burkholderiaceae bacterium]|nr:DUF4089 domain-containing protein [Burkholderiaceae bacterium]MDZ4145763.1 AtzG-like protein [Burkholderiales bacterium]
MNDDVLAYVQSTGALLGIPMDTARAQRVAAHLQRTAALAALLAQAPLTPEDELAEIFNPDCHQVPVERS